MLIIIGPHFCGEIVGEIRKSDEKKLKEKSLIEIKNLNNFIINKQVSTLIVKK